MEAVEDEGELAPRTYRGYQGIGSLKVYVELSKELAVTLNHTGHLKIGWVTCREKKKVQTIRR